MNATSDRAKDRSSTFIPPRSYRFERDSSEDEDVESSTRIFFSPLLLNTARDIRYVRKKERQCRFSKEENVAWESLIGREFGGSDANFLPLFVMFFLPSRKKNPLIMQETIFSMFQNIYVFVRF